MTITNTLHSAALRTAIGAAALLPLALPAQADDIADFYSGKVIRISIGGSAAGAFTLTARILGESMKNHLPGNPTFLIEPKPGAGGAKSMDFIMNAAVQDGTNIGAVLPPAVTAPLLRKLRYDGSKAQWLGSVTPMSEMPVGGTAFRSMATDKPFIASRVPSGRKHTPAAPAATTSCLPEHRL